MTAVLSLRDAHAGYGARVVLRGIDLELRPGELTAVLGPNGAGKTTLLRVLSGLLPLRSGAALLDGAPIADVGREVLARRVAVVPQELPLVEGFTVREIVAMGRAPHQGRWMRAAPDDDALVARALHRAGLDPLAERPFAEISGGERKRVVIAQALAQAPAALLLDEPSAFLDARHAIETFALLREEAAAGLSILANVHDLSLARRYADRALLLSADGAPIAAGPVDDVLAPEPLRRAFGVEVTLVDAAGVGRALVPRALLRG